MQKNIKKNIFYHLGLSIIAAILLLVLAFFNPSENVEISAYDKILIVGLFIIICIFGISLAFFPGWHKQFLKNKNTNSQAQHNKKTSRKRKGHHPDCTQFKNHVLPLKNKTLCAGCLGLALGSIFTIFLGIIYIFFVNKSLIIFRYLIFLGFFLISMAYLEIFLPKRNSIIHIIANAFLIAGFFIISISIFETSGRIIFVIISIIFSFLFLDTRVQLSCYQHTTICNKCKNDCKMY